MDFYDHGLEFRERRQKNFKKFLLETCISHILKSIIQNIFRLYMP